MQLLTLQQLEALAEFLECEIRAREPLEQSPDTPRFFVDETQERWSDRVQEVHRIEEGRPVLVAHFWIP
ncbi:hypothetical protein [uncultured Meiothermus sp.]|jgi:hypothetical protein|uniref:hypothetical protein n=1 Tax=uncultured Meiothermus sp. TaxID=157471 RepID=UPI00261D0AD0|nr:hypothetical protein [uncultured Meiothermus sp.]